MIDIVGILKQPVFVLAEPQPIRRVDVAEPNKRLTQRKLEYV